MRFKHYLPLFILAFISSIACICSQDLQLDEGALKLTTVMGVGLPETVTISNSLGSLFLDPASGHDVHIPITHDMVLDSGTLRLNNGTELIFESDDESKYAHIGLNDNRVMYLGKYGSPPSLVVDIDERRLGVNFGIPKTELDVQQEAALDWKGFGNIIDNIGGLLIRRKDNGQRINIVVDEFGDLAIGFEEIGRAYIQSSTGKLFNASNVAGGGVSRYVESTSDGVLSKILSIPMMYSVNKARQSSSIEIDARMLRKYFPHVTDVKDDIIAISYADLGPIAIKAIQEQQTIIDQQSKDIAALQVMVQKLLEQ